MPNERNTPAIRFLILLLILIVCWLLGQYVHLDVEGLKAVLRSYPPAVSGGIYIVLYVLISTFLWFGPKDIFRVVGALVFGGYWSALWVWIAEMINLVIMFQMSRRLGQAFVERRLGRRRANFQRMKKTTGVLGIAALRLPPLIPIRMLDLGFGLSKVPLRRYWLVCAIVTFPRILWQQVILDVMGGHLFDGIAVMTDYMSDHMEVIVISLIYFLLIVGVLIAALIEKWLQRKESTCMT